MKNKKQWIDFLTKKAKFKLTDEEVSKFEKDLDIFIHQLKDLDKFDLSNIEPISMPFVKQENLLRDDDVIENNSNMIVSNASNSKNGYILLKNKVDKNV